MSTQSDHAIMLRIDPWIFRLDLTLEEKMLLNFIYSWSIMNKCTSIDEDWIAYKFNWEASFVLLQLDLLKMKGYIRLKQSETTGARLASFIFSDVADPCEDLEEPESIIQID